MFVKPNGLFINNKTNRNITIGKVQMSETLRLILSLPSREPEEDDEGEIATNEDRVECCKGVRGAK